MARSLHCLQTDLAWHKKLNKTKSILLVSESSFPAIGWVEW